MSREVRTCRRKRDDASGVPDPITLPALRGKWRTSDHILGEEMYIGFPKCRCVCKISGEMAPALASDLGYKILN